MTTYLSPKELAIAIGVSESSLKRWIDEGRIDVQRTSGGHRRIPVVEAMRFVRDGRHPLRDPSCLGVDARHVGVAGEGLEERLHGALVDGDGALCRGLLTAAFLAGQPISSLCDGAVRGAMQRIGCLWEHGADGIAVEHLATSLCRQAVEQLRLMLPRPPGDAPVALGGAHDDDPYVLPSLMAATTLDEAGCRAHDLGPGTSTAVILAAVERHRPALVWRSISSTADARACAAHVRALADAIAPTPLLVGGRCLPELMLTSVRNIHAMQSMGELAAYAKGYMARMTTVDRIAARGSRPRSPRL